MKTASYAGLRLGRPISVNAMYRSVVLHGRVMSMKSTKYRKWLLEQTELLALQNPPHVPGEYVCYLTLPSNYRGDVDGAAKCFLDLLQNSGVTENDRNCIELRVVRGVEKNVTSIMLISKKRWDDGSE